MSPGATSLAIGGRLPGVRCEPALPVSTDDAIRLDVAAFVGLAERGPVDTPVTVDDRNQYMAVFGGDLPLALGDRGVPVYAALPSAVRAFFDNGGRRCVVVRVVGPRASVAPLSVDFPECPLLGGGLAVTGLCIVGVPVIGQTLTGRPFELQAASPGGWAEGVSVSATVTEEVLPVTPTYSPIGPATLTPAGRRMVEPGDVLHVASPDGEAWLVWVREPGPPVVASAMVRCQMPSPLGPALSVEVDPATPWPAVAVVRRLRLTLTVRRADGAGSHIVERVPGLRLGATPDRYRPSPTPSWLDVAQLASGGFDRSRSMFLRATGDSERLLPVVGVAPAVAAETRRTLPRPDPFTAAALVRDDLGAFSLRSLFLDERFVRRKAGGGFINPPIEGVRSTLSALTLEDTPRLHGIHAVAALDEVAVVALPDLYHRQWSEAVVPVTPVPDPAPAAPDPVPPNGFTDCGAAAPPQPRPARPPAPNATPALVLDPPDHYPIEDLIGVHAAVATLCAARGDMVAVLGMPLHASADDARNLGERLVAEPTLMGTAALSYIGLWHPWPQVIEERSPQRSPLRAIPPDGPVCGVLAARERAGGAWTAPAGSLLAGVVARAGSLDRQQEVALFDAPANVIRRRPGGFESAGAHSLSVDPSFLQLSVRRLLILVRKLALREGNRYVFAADNDALRQQLRATFARLLERLRTAGALTAYEVVVPEAATAVGSEEGRLRIDLKLAPTSPVEYLTVSLLREGEDLLAVGGS
jgi:uncharacterized protein